MTKKVGVFSEIKCINNHAYGERFWLKLFKCKINLVTDVNERNTNVIIIATFFQIRDAGSD